VLVLLGLAAALAAGPGHAAEAFTAVVVRVVDGDTIAVRAGGRVEKVRYIGIDAPETRHPIRGAEPGGREASAANRRLVQGRTVRIELDVRARDRYGRLLGYVYVGDLMINAEMVRLGYAHAATVPPNVAHAALFRALEREARAASRGLWAAR
jgi:micrococcal nuclease